MAPLLGILIQALIPVAVKEVEKRYQDSAVQPTKNEVVIEAAKDTIVGSVKSKTTWAAFIIAILGVVEANQGLLSSWIGPDKLGVVMAVIAGIMYVLRTITTTAITEK